MKGLWIADYRPTSNFIFLRKTMDNEIIDLISYLEKPDIYREEISQLQKRVQVLENTVETLRSNTDDQWKSYRRYLCSSCEKTLRIDRQAKKSFKNIVFSFWGQTLNLLILCLCSRS